MSYLEIYNENIRDLLEPGKGHLDLRDDHKGKNIQVAGLSEISTKSTEEVMTFSALKCSLSLIFFSKAQKLSFFAFQIFYFFNWLQLTSLFRG